LALVQQALALDDSLPNAHSRLGQIYTQKQQYDQAVAAGERAIALDPNNADSYGFQAEVLILAGRPEEARQAAQQAMRLNPRYPHFYITALGTAYRLTGRDTEAIATLKEAVSRNPNDFAAHLNLAISYLAQWGSQQGGDDQTLTQAFAAAQRVIALNDSVPWGHVTLGYVYLLQKQYEQAVSEMERAVALDPNDAWGYTALAETLGWMGKPEEVLQLVEQALRRKPVTVDEHLVNIGVIYHLVGRPEEAIAPLKQYLSRYPNMLVAHLLLAAAYSKLGREAEAQAAAAEVLRLNPNFSLEVTRQRSPDKDPARLERSIAALRKAGLK
jgi:adenylate cyclase